MILVFFLKFICLGLQYESTNTAETFCYAVESLNAPTIAGLSSKHSYKLDLDDYGASLRKNSQINVFFRKIIILIPAVVLFFLPVQFQWQPHTTRNVKQVAASNLQTQLGKRWCALRKLVRTGTCTAFYQLSTLRIKIPTHTRKQLQINLFS